MIAIEQAKIEEESEEPHRYHYAEPLAEYLLYGRLPYSNGGTDWEYCERRKRGLVFKTDIYDY